MSTKCRVCQDVNADNKQYQCCHCGKNNACANSDCILWVYVNGNEKQPICQECFLTECDDNTDIRTCNDCNRVCRCEFSTCLRCHKTDICDDCRKLIGENNRKPLCMNCYKEYILVKNKT
jgi:hypothetical protein